MVPGLIMGLAACILPQAFGPTENSEHADYAASVFSVGTPPPASIPRWVDPWFNLTEVGPPHSARSECHPENASIRCQRGTLIQIKVSGG